MEAVLQSLWSGLPVLFLHTITTFLLLAAGVWVYEKVTPYRELELIRQGNLAASITFAGAILGMAVPLAFAMNASVGLLDLAVWGLVTVILQIVAFFFLDMTLKNVRTKIEANDLPSAMIMMAVKLAVGAVTAAAVSG